MLKLVKGRIMENLIEMIDNESLEKISHDYIQSKLDEYEEVMMIITPMIMSEDDGVSLATFIESSALTYDLKYTIIILSDEVVHEKVLDIIPNLSTYPTTMLAKDGEFYKVLEDNFFES
jgi:predicted house-cleaning noncanonical NTP pyrophosphatase (MazG superfamily)